MKFEDMNAMQRRLHNAAIVLDGDGDEWGFVGMLREAIDEIERLRKCVPADLKTLPGNNGLTPEEEDEAQAMNDIAP